MTAPMNETTERHAQALEAMRAEFDYADTDAVRALDAAIRALRQGGGWIPLSERLPENYEQVDVYPDPRADTYSFYATHDGGTNGVKAGRWYHNDAQGYDNEIRVTHWQPLPPAPASEEPK